MRPAADPYGAPDQHCHPIFGYNNGSSRLARAKVSATPHECVRLVARYQTVPRRPGHPRDSRSRNNQSRFSASQLELVIRTFARVLFNFDIAEGVLASDGSRIRYLYYAGTSPALSTTSISIIVNR